MSTTLSAIFYLSMYIFILNKKIILCVCVCLCLHASAILSVKWGHLIRVEEKHFVTLDIRLQSSSELKHVTWFFLQIYQSWLLRADGLEAVEPWLPFLNRTLDSLRNLRNLRTRLGNPEREDLVGALLRGFKRNNPSSDAFKIYF